MPVIKPVNEKLLDRYIRHSVYIERFKAGEAARISRHLNKEVFPELIDKLIVKLRTVDPSKLQKLWAVKRLKRLTLSVDKIIAAGMVKAEKATISSLMDLAEWEAKWNKGVIEELVPLDIDMAMPNPEVLRQSVLSTPFEGHKLKTWFKGYSKSVRVGMMGAVKKGIASGESIPNIARRLRKVTSLKRQQAEAIARTAVSSVVNNAKEVVFAQNTDLIKAAMLVATLDTRTTLICINLDGKTFPIGEGPRPPMHFSCRTTTVPVLSSWKEFGIKAPPPATRASMTGKVPAKQTYKGWLRKQSKATQVKVLGKKRTELYRSGQVTIDKFVGKDYKPLTLKQIAKREDIALPAPPIVEAISVKGTGIKFIDSDRQILRRYSEGDFKNIVPIQLGGKYAAKFSPVMKRRMLVNAKDLEHTISKLKGWDGVSYRGMTFTNKAEKIKFLSKLKKGGVYKSKSFLATSKSQSMAEEFALLKAQNLTMIIEGRSGRDISRYWGASMKEVLFKKGTAFKVNKVVGNKVYLSEITKQAQLKAVPKIVKAIPVKGTGVSLNSADKNVLNQWSWGGAEYSDITKVQRGLKSRLVAKSVTLKAERRLIGALNKLDGFSGTTYRGMIFDTAAKKVTFLKQFKSGGVWKSKTFLASSKSEAAIRKITGQRNSLTMVIKGKSGKDISKWAALPEEKEVLFMKGVPLKVDKVTRNKVYLTEL